MKKIVLPFLIFFCFSLFSQQKMDTLGKTRWQLFQYDIGNMFKSIGYSYGRPLQWGGSQWAQFGAVVGGTGGAYLIDDNASKFFRGLQDDVPHAVKEYGTLYGSPQNNYIATSGVYLVGLVTRNEKLRRTGVLLVASASSSGLLQQVLKTVVGRARPEAELGKDTFDPFNSDRAFASFPSGHTLLAFSNAYAIGKQFKSPWVKSGIYILGAIPGISRMWDGQHWLSDFVLSMAISVFTVESIDRYLDRKYDEKYNDQVSKKMSWNLSFGPGTLGVQMQF